MDASELGERGRDMVEGPCSDSFLTRLASGSLRIRGRMWRLSAIAANGVLLVLTVTRIRLATAGGPAGCDAEISRTMMLPRSCFISAGVTGVDGSATGLLNLRLWWCFAALSVIAMVSAGTPKVRRIFVNSVLWSAAMSAIAIALAFERNVAIYHNHSPLLWLRLVVWSPSLVALALAVSFRLQNPWSIDEYVDSANSSLVPHTPDHSGSPDILAA